MVAMPALDTHHYAVINALVKDGWTITQNPLTLPIPDRVLYIDLGISHLVGAVKGQETIAIEVKSFTNYSPMADLQISLGQYLVYKEAIQMGRFDMKLYLALPEEAYQKIFVEEEIGQVILAKYLENILTYDEVKEEIVRWIPLPAIMPT